MTPDHILTILDALEFQERKFSAQLDREPRTRGGKQNMLRLSLQKDLQNIAEARIAITKVKALQWLLAC